MSKFDLVTPTVKITKDIKPYVTFPLLNACTEKCVFCGYGGEMSLCEVRQFNTVDLLEWHRLARAAGIEKFRLTGGEPLLHKDFTTIVRKLSADAAVVLINTNGTLLEKHPGRWRGSSANCHYVVNVHSATEEVFDLVSRTKGYYGAVRRGIELLAGEDLLYRLNIVLNKFNMHEIWDIIAYCQELGTDLKIQDVVSVPWAFGEWQDIYVDTTELEREFEAQSTFTREHEYARCFGTPTKIYTINGVNVTFKSIRNGSHYDRTGVCQECSYYPCFEGVYDLFVFPDNTAWACNWTDRARAPDGTKEEQLEYMIRVFQRSVYRSAVEKQMEWSGDLR